ncbi:hypothetical protein [Halomonas urumqiensis]|uniref:Uncharacterized protein n=1 Tax=Halomonas urumqiensis TaxID=1684789 RepID=A0A2N7UFA0_9GAMM|nr:hypothetical protein [Halomonas urumqiensis]PMR79103.1 hypothetical protein C1H70_12405 [Halomonas urumqiensis]PTB03777.1 hypothetical protein C6V82_04690 [Halomonas urumqiensis]GHE19995.1 hypothetical protein GCM10017767_05160 [Halomonas urumqiensis]
MTIRQLETVTAGVHSVHYTAWDWAELAAFPVRGMRDGMNTWYPGRSLTSARDLQLDAIRWFREYSAQLDTIRQNSDLTSAAKERQAREILDTVMSSSRAAITQMTGDIQSIYDTATTGLRPFTPLADNDVAGHLRDQELRAFLRETGGKNELVGQMVNGEHPEMVAAVLRSTSHLLTGLDVNQVNRIERAGIGAEHSEAVEMLKLMVSAHHDARITGRRVALQLATIGDLTKSAELGREIDRVFATIEVADQLNDWLAPIPTTPLKLTDADPAMTQPVPSSATSRDVLMEA